MRHPVKKLKMGYVQDSPDNFKVCMIHNEKVVVSTYNFLLAFAKELLNTPFNEL